MTWFEGMVNIVKKGYVKTNNLDTFNKIIEYFKKQKVEFSLYTNEDAYSKYVLIIDSTKNSKILDKYNKEKDDK